MSSQQIIYAKNGVIDKDYLLVLSKSAVYKITIKKINKIDDDVLSVGIVDERYSKQLVNISAETALLEFDEVMYQTAKDLRRTEIVKDKVYNTNKTKTEKEVIKMPQNKNPRSKVIDQYLASLKDEEPDYQKIVDLVVESGRGTIDDAKKIIFQAKLRYKWYTIDGKVNPFNKSNGVV